MKLHVLKLLRNFFPAITGFIVGAYFGAKYYVLLATIKYARETRNVPLFETPEVFIYFYISIVFVVTGLRLNLLWIFVLAKFHVD